MNRIQLGSPFPAALLICALLNGCIGYNTALFATKTNVGVDLDAKPPTAEISIARRELAVVPAYESGHPALVGSFVQQKGAHLPFFPRVSTTFAGGDTAKIMTRLYNNGSVGTKGTDDDSSLPLSQDIADKNLLGIFPMHNQRPGEVHPFFFGTDTTIGLKVAWSGATGASGFPDSAKLGIHRKELAIAPVYIIPADPSKKQVAKAYAHMGSFLATQDTSVDVGAQSDTGIDHIQYFATGDAADNLALQPTVRHAMIQRMDPGASSKAAALVASQKGIFPKQNQILAAYKALSTANKQSARDQAKALGFAGSTDDSSFRDSILFAAKDAKYDALLAAIQKLGP